jgi:hypothetical protein
MIPRRTFLRGLGTTMALPWLESLTTQSVRANGFAAASLAHPNRMVFVYVPNGVIKDKWTPTEVGSDYQLTPTLQPLQKVKDDLIVFTNLSQDNGRSKGDGGGDHARGTASFLTGEHPYKTDGAAIRVGVSVDQVAASQIGSETPFPSLVLGTEQGGRSGNCDSGYSCAYSSSISWKSATTPMMKEVNPKLVFERLFGDGIGSEELRKQRDFYRRSILDVVTEDARRLQKRLGQTDRRKMDEYFQSVREIEQRIERAVPPKSPPTGFAAPEGVPEDYEAYIRLMYDLIAVGLQTDSSRIATFMTGNAGDNRAYNEVDAKEGWHSLSHHQNDPEKVATLERIDDYHISQFAYFLEKLKSIEEGNETLLDHCMIMYGSELGDGNAHSHHDLPILLAGRGAGTIASGRHIRCEKETPLNNLFLSMLDRMGTPVDELGDSTGRLTVIGG